MDKAELNDMKSGPLVSVILVTYNSSDFVVEALESIRNQTYRNVELIVSDDCSKDNTREICREWLERNGGSFVSATLVCTDQNQGIAGNCNNGISVAGGEWIKLLGGDDVLDNSCLERFVALAREEPHRGLIFSDIYSFTDDLTQARDYPSIARYFQFNPELQWVLLLWRDYLPAPGAFLRREMILEAGGFDIRYPMMEDYPLWVKCMRAGYFPAYLPARTVYYRIHGISVSNNSTVAKVSDRYLRSVLDFYHDVLIGEAKKVSWLVVARIRLSGLLLYTQNRQPWAFRLLYPLAWANERFGDQVLAYVLRRYREKVEKTKQEEAAYAGR